MVKTAEELLKIMKASAIGDACFSHILNFIKVGMTEKQVADEINSTLMALGASGLAFPTICVSGVRGCLPHGEPSCKVIEDGDMVTMDFGAIVGGYCGDMTRTIAVGRVTDEQERIYCTVLKAQEAALAAARVGVKCAHVDKVARDLITAAGYGEYFVHGTGHGVGQKVHEAPTLNSKSAEVLEENIPFTVEPGIYLPDKMGVRIEDLAIVTNFGIINTVKSTKELIII